MWKENMIFNIQILKIKSYFTDKNSDKNSIKIWLVGKNDVSLHTLTKSKGV